MENLNLIESLITIRCTLIDIQTKHQKAASYIDQQRISALSADEQTFH